eukprot:8132874-Alexandrium_andersonii.AAC.2
MRSNDERFRDGWPPAPRTPHRRIRSTGGATWVRRAAAAPAEQWRVGWRALWKIEIMLQTLHVFAVGGKGQRPGPD